MIPAIVDFYQTIALIFLSNIFP